jgi:hypothetical protein
MAIEDSVIHMTQQTSNLLDVFLKQRDNVGDQIKVAVAESENAALTPLVGMATNLIDTQTLLVQFIVR